jgi:hypothetical protein
MTAKKSAYFQENLSQFEHFFIRSCKHLANRLYIEQRSCARTESLRVIYVHSVFICHNIISCFSEMKMELLIWASRVAGSAKNVELRGFSDC